MNRPDALRCLHCGEELDGNDAFEGIGELFCGLFCFTAVATYNHGEDCSRGECSDAAEAFTLPAMLCASCSAPEPTGANCGACEARIRNAFAYQVGARMGARA